MAESDILAVIDALYGAALEPDGWEQALAAVSQAVGAIGISIVPLEAAGDMRSIASENLAEANADYQKTWWRHDTPTARLVSRGIKPGTVGTDRLVMDEDEIRSDPFYQEFLRHYGIGQCLAAVTPLGSGRLFSIAAQRSLKRSLFERGDVETLGVLSPHIGRAVSVGLALADARRMAADLASAVERLAWGLVLLDSEGRARHVNSSALALLGDGFTITHQRPRATLRSDDARLQAAIQAALPDSASRLGSGILIRRPRGQAPLYAEIVPIRSGTDAMEALAFGAGGAMLLIRSLAGDTKGAAPHLRALGLTPSEVRIAEIVGGGGTLRSAAETCGITYETARSHLRGIFSKLGIGRQAELVALVTRLLADVARS